MKENDMTIINWEEFKEQISNSEYGKYL